MKKELEQAIQKSVEAVLKEEGLEQCFQVQLSRPKLPEHGDYACNVAMPLASRLRKSPRLIAQRIVDLTSWPSYVAEVEIAGPGFINIRLRQYQAARVLIDILRQGNRFGCSAEKGEKVCVEFVSANPTGPMHVGHGRGAVVGDALANILAARGAFVHREYYVNDAGTQVKVLADSVWFRMQQLAGKSVSPPKEYYPGEYLVDVARRLMDAGEWAHVQDMDENERREHLAQAAVSILMEEIRKDLDALGIHFDQFFSERSLHASGRIQALIETLLDRGLAYVDKLPPPKGVEVQDYQATEQLLFRTTDYGDDIDRPLLKQDGTPTYFAADIAYHLDKFERGFRRQINVWGADHAGYVARVQAAMKAITGLEGEPEVVLVQMVNLTRGGKPVRMSKRAGTFVTLREVINEVGRDAVRFNFLTRRAESQLEFDLELAKQQSEDNPVYYVQYAHARCCAIERKAEAQGVGRLDAEEVDLSGLVCREERELIKTLSSYPETLAKAASRREPYRLAVYLMQLAGLWHAYYHKYRVIGAERETMKARLLLTKAVRQVIGNGLRLLNVRAPEVM